MNLAARDSSGDHKPGFSAVAVVGLLLAAIGLAISLYATQHHIEVKMTGASDAFCNINDTFSCDDIARSQYSEIFSTPVAVFGSAYFLSLLLLLGVGIGKPEYRRDTNTTYAFMAVVGVVVSVVFAAISFFVLDKVCPTCLAVYFVTFAQAANIFIFKAQLPSKPWALKSLSNGSSYVFISIALGIGSYQFLKPTPHDFKQDLSQAAIERLRKQAEGQQSILELRPISITVDTSPYSGLGEDYRKGPDDAKVRIVEFADFECPACRGAYNNLKVLKKDYGDAIQIVFKNFPLDSSCNSGVNRKLHENACKAAVYARCAGLYGKFWQMHDKIFDNQSSLSEKNLMLWAKSIGLSDSQVLSCRDSEDLLNKIKSDIQQGNKVGVNSTPTIYFNGYKVIGNDRSVQAMRREIERFLNQ